MFVDLFELWSSIAASQPVADDLGYLVGWLGCLPCRSCGTVRQAGPLSLGPSGLSLAGPLSLGPSAWRVGRRCGAATFAGPVRPSADAWWRGALNVTGGRRPVDGTRRTRPPAEAEQP